MKNYHAHIYFTDSQRPLSENMVSNLLTLNLPSLSLYKYHDKKVGPHALPMAEVNFTSQDLKAVLDCLKQHHPDLSTLVHEDSGDDYKDHEAPIWIGHPLPIDFEFFAKVKAQPHLSVH